MVARFLDGLPHGAYFGVASLVAASMVRRPTARAARWRSVMLGLSVANVVGVPAATWLGQSLGWRAAYWLVARARPADRGAGRWPFVPACPGDRGGDRQRELAALRRAAGAG